MNDIRGRLQKEATQAVIEYTSSLPFDKRLYRHDICGSIAHVRMLAKQSIISPNEAENIIAGLKEIENEIGNGRFIFDSALEDIHMAIEHRLSELVGPVAGKLHTARSRNDQIALDMRLYTKEAIQTIIESIRLLQKALVYQANSNRDVVMPGYTHMQPAQPVLLAHHLLAYFEMMQRDISRFEEALKRVDVLPLGSGALAGAAYNLDRNYVALELGFREVSKNSLDAVSDRDFVIDYLSCASICMSHISRLAEELVLWSTVEFSFIEIDDSYATPSSIMPQKKNPDVAELGRGKTGRVYGHLMGMLTTIKGLPLSYNRDMQEDKEALFDAHDTLSLTLKVFASMIETIRINPSKMNLSLMKGYILATDIADYLVKKGLPFREAHRITGRIVCKASEDNRTLEDITVAEYKSYCQLFDEDIKNICVNSSITSKNVIGGTASSQVAQQLEIATKIVNSK